MYLTLLQPWKKAWRTFNPFNDGQRVAQKPHFSPIPLLWTGFRLISIRIAKNEFCKKKGIFSDQSDVIKQFFVFHACAKAKIYFQRVACKQRNWQWIFPQNVTFFRQCNSVRIGQDIQNEVSLERCICADVVAYQFINLNWEQNGSRKEDVRRSTWNENDQSSRRRVN